MGSIKGQVVSGDFGAILVRQKSDEKLELGEILVAETDNGKVLLQVYDLQYGSQLSQQSLELISGIKLEDNSELEIFDSRTRNYTMAMLKPLISISEGRASLCKSLPDFFSTLREITKEDLSFIARPDNSLFVGKLRSGSKTLDVDVELDGSKALAHHILIPATTGRGKSNLTSCMLWSSVDKPYCGILVLDPHDEYYGRTGPGLKDHPSHNLVVYYTPKQPPPGCRTLIINVKDIRPQHFSGVVDFSDPQRQALNMYHKQFGEKWIEAVILEKPLRNVAFRDDTLAVVKRRIMATLDLSISEQRLVASGIFSLSSGTTTIHDICSALEDGKTVIIDTSSFSGSVEILVGGLVASEVFSRYRHYKMEGKLSGKPVISIILEEAPRVLGKEVLERGPNIFGTIAREGRKFRVGLVAITQLPSLIPRQILANMNTKIILGVEMKPERQAIIESASQDLSTYDRSIASLDVGEAIVTSNFSKFAMPVRIPLFSELVMRERKRCAGREKVSNSFDGVKGD